MDEAALAPTASLDVRWPKKADVLGVRVSCVDYDAAVSCIIAAAKSSHRAIAIDVTRVEVPAGHRSPQ
jgi:hypothetical protein